MSTNRKVDGPPDALNTYSPRFTNLQTRRIPVLRRVVFLMRKGGDFLQNGFHATHAGEVPAAICNYLASPPAQVAGSPHVAVENHACGEKSSVDAHAVKKVRCRGVRAKTCTYGWPVFQPGAQATRYGAVVSAGRAWRPPMRPVYTAWQLPPPARPCNAEFRPRSHIRIRSSGRQRVRLLRMASR